MSVFLRSLIAGTFVSPFVFVLVVNVVDFVARAHVCGCFVVRRDVLHRVILTQCAARVWSHYGCMVLTPYLTVTSRAHVMMSYFRFVFRHVRPLFLVCTSHDLYSWLKIGFRCMIGAMAAQTVRREVFLQS